MIEQLKEDIKQAKRILILTGAGISKDTGIPTYRGEGGVWNADTLKFGTLKYFRENREEYMKWWAPQAAVINAALPGPTHHAIHNFVRLHKDKVTYATQNIDLLEELVFDEDIAIIRLHGFLWETDAYEIERDDNWRPPIMFFDESYTHPLWRHTFDEAMMAAEEADVILFVGTSMSVGATDSAYIYSKLAAKLYFINPDPPPQGYVMTHIKGTAYEVFTCLLCS